MDIFKFHLNLYLNFFFIFLIAPTKRRSVSGSTSILGNGLDSPCSSRASVAGSSVSEAWSTASTAAMTDMTDMEAAGVQPSQPPQSNMVLRKRIRRIRQGMKRYNDQLVEVKKELKVCKSKMETQTKTVTEYSNVNIYFNYVYYKVIYISLMVFLDHYCLYNH